MESNKFIINKLREIYSLLSYLEIRYEYRNDISTHIIEVKPLHCFDKDKSYIAKQIALEEEFETEFPNEEILFMTENVLIQIENPILELGTSFIELNSAELIDGNYRIEKESLSFDLKELFGILTKVNVSDAPYFYIQCSQMSDRTKDNKDSYKVALPNMDYLCEAKNHYGIPKNVNETTKKDSETNQSLFFY